MKPICALLLPLMFLALPAKGEPLQYTITRQAFPGQEIALRIDLQFSSSGQDTVWFHLPNRISWSGGLWRCYDSIAVSDPGVRLWRRDSLHLALLCPPGPATYTLRYRLRQLRAFDAVTRALSLSPILQEQYIHVPGECLFLFPRHYKTFEIAVRWQGLPADWSMQSNWASGEIFQQFQAANTDWRNGIWVAGDFRTHRGVVFGRPVYVAIRGTWALEDRVMVDAVLRTIGTQRAQWKDTLVPYYSVTMIPLVRPEAPVPEDQQRELVGYGQFQSFAVYAGRNCTAVRLARLLNHEMMHNWIGGKIRDGPPGQSDALNWFAEGFTDYYALRNRWKAGFIDQEEFFLEWNDRFLSMHYADTLGDLPEAALRSRRYTDDRAFKVPYRRGAILAFYFDCAIRKHSANQHTLHDAMLEVLAYYGDGRRNLSDHFGFFVETLGKYLGEDPADMLRRYARDGKRIPPDRFRLPDFMQMDVDNAGTPQFFLRKGDPDAAVQFLKW